MGVDPSRTILVELGPIRRASDFEGLNVVRLSNDGPKRNALRSRRMSAGCAVSELRSLHSGVVPLTRTPAFLPDPI